jgi:hypothetical protein
VGLDEIGAVLIGHAIPPGDPDPRENFTLLGVIECVPGVVVALVEG